MAVDLTFAAAYIDNDSVHRVLGVKLRPFCPWHLFLLQVIESPFLNSGSIFNFHLRRAVGVCRLKFPHSRTRLPLFPLVMTQKKLKRETDKLIIYFKDYIQKPEYSIIPFNEMNHSLSRSRPSNRGPSPAPEAVQLVFDAAHGANISVSEAWNMPIGQAYIAQAMHYKMEGVLVDFMTEEEREFQTKLKEHLEKQKNGDN